MRSITIPFWVGADIWVSALELGSQAKPAGLAQLWSLVGWGLLAKGPGPKPIAPTSSPRNKWPN